jgi:hypothetical protein
MAAGFILLRRDSPTYVYRGTPSIGIRVPVAIGMKFGEARLTLDD